MTKRRHGRRPRFSFVGRETELARCDEVLRRSPAVVLWGLGGLGKSSLAQRLAALAGVMPDRCVVVGAPTGMTLAELASRVASEMGASRRWPASRLQGEAAVARLVELLEPEARWLVVDDVHRMGDTAAKALFEQFAARAETARLVMTSRVTLATPDSIDAHVQVGPLSEEELGLLLAQLRPELHHDVLAQLAAMSGGSPWVARSLAAAAASSPTVVQETMSEAVRTRSIFEGLDATTRRAVNMLASVRTVVSTRTLERIVPSGVVATLETHGLTERTARGVRLHDVAREQLAVVSPPRDSRELAEALSRSEEPWELVEAIASWAALGDLERADALADEHGARILRAVDPNETFRTLCACPPSVALGLRLRCVIRSGDAVATAWAGQLDRPTHPRARAVWLEIIATLGRRDEAWLGLAAMRSEQAEARVDAALARCRLARTRGEALEALEVLDEPGPGAESGRPSAMFLASKTRALVFAGRMIEALGVFQRARDSLARGAVDDAEAASLLFAISAYLGRYRQAEEIAEEQPWLSNVTTASGADLYVLALLATERGSARRAEELVATMDARTGRAIVWRFLGNYLRARVAITSGRFAEAQATISQLFDDASISNRPDFHAWARIAHLRCGAARGGDPSTPPWPSGLDLPGGPEAQLLECYLRIDALRRGGEAHAEGLTSDGSPLVQQVLCMVEAWRAWSAGELDGALSKAEEALAHARANGALVEELDIAGTCIAWLQAAEARASPRLRELAQRVHELATRVESPRFLSVAEQVLAGAAPREVALTAFVDSDRASVRLVDGRVVSLTSHPLGLRLIEVIIAGGGVASKERLAREVWGVRSYVSRRDDKRIQVMVRRLRTLLERDPSTPSILRTVPDGYSLRAD